MERYIGLEPALGDSVCAKVRSSQVLVVGAGGIGCELLKCLVLCGFHHLHVIDLDTIDLSNLNRQFLFRRHHVGHSKAVVACESVGRFNPLCHIEAHHDNVMSASFGPQFFSQFSLVLNALDNIAARKHVNRLCLAANVPLIESGTGGYLGQVQTIQKGVTECYECKPKPAPKGYAACTINNSPSRPIHCIVWAKWKFIDFFSQGSQKAEGKGERKEGEEEEEEEKEEKWEDDVMRAEDEALERQKERGYEWWLFYKLFHRDIVYQLRMGLVAGKDIWKGRPPPVPIELPSNDVTIEQSDHPDGHRLWTIDQNISIFLRSVRSLRQRLITFDFEKDDEDCMDFVTAASNLRGIAYHIEGLSRFDAKAQAGNIIPAIATTNAVIAGVVVLEAIKVLEGKISECKNVFLLKKPSAKRMILTSPLEDPSKGCFVCSSNCVTLRLIPSKVTLRYFIDTIVKTHLNLIEPLVFHDNSIIFDCSDDLEEDEKEHFENQSRKTLSDLEILTNTILRIEDNVQSISIDLLIDSVESIPSVSTAGEEGEERVFELISDGDLQKREAHDVGLAKEVADGGDDLEIVQCLSPTTSTSFSSLTSLSQSSTSEVTQSPVRKRRKVA